MLEQLKESGFRQTLFILAMGMLQPCNGAEGSSPLPEPNSFMSSAKMSGYVSTEKIGIRQWSNDSQIFFEQVLKPMRESFVERDCTANFTDYFGSLFNQLRTIKTTVTAKSYLLLREIITVSAEELAPFELALQCEVLNRWELLEIHLRSKTELVGNMFLILE